MMKNLPTILTVSRMTMGPILAALILWAGEVVYADSRFTHESEPMRIVREGERVARDVIARAKLGHLLATSPGA